MKFNFFSNSQIKKSNNGKFADISKAANNQRARQIYERPRSKKIHETDRPPNAPDLLHPEIFVTAMKSFQKLSRHFTIKKFNEFISTCLKCIKIEIILKYFQ